MALRALSALAGAQGEALTFHTYLRQRRAGQGALFEAIARLVEALASRAPVVLFLDDLQWADAATLEVLDYVGKRWAEQGAPVLVLIAARPEEPEAGSAFERRLASSGRVVLSAFLAVADEVEDARAAGDKAGSSKPPGAPGGRGDFDEVELGSGSWEPARSRDRRSALLPGGDAQGPARGHAPYTKPRRTGRGSWR